MTAARMETAIWVLLYGGLALVIVGLWSLEHAVGWPHALVAVGAVLVIAGVLLIWLRSRLGETEPGKKDR
jgi:hypothetical protein